VLASGDSGAETKETERNGPFFLAHPRSWLNPFFSSKISHGVAYKLR
jgi:hypothetical protein